MEGMSIWEENYTQRSEDFDHGIYMSGVGKGRGDVQREEEEIVYKEEKADGN